MIEVILFADKCYAWLASVTDSEHRVVSSHECERS